MNYTPKDILSHIHYNDLYDDDEYYHDYSYDDAIEVIETCVSILNENEIKWKIIYKSRKAHYCDFCNKNTDREEDYNIKKNYKYIMFSPDGFDKAGYQHYLDNKKICLNCATNLFYCMQVL